MLTFSVSISIFLVGKQTIKGKNFSNFSGSSIHFSRGEGFARSADGKVFSMLFPIIGRPGAAKP